MCLMMLLKYVNEGDRLTSSSVLRFGRSLKKSVLAFYFIYYFCDIEMWQPALGCRLHVP